MLKLTNVKTAFQTPDGHRQPVLDIADYEIQTSEQVVLIGQSGCGKTTLLHCIAGISSIDSGSIELDGILLTKLSEAGRDRVRASKIGYVFQTFNLLPGFTALENVRLGMTFGQRKHDIQRAVKLLEQVGLGDRLHHKPRALSVGQQQRVAVARALANRPKLLLADEPTANIDPANQQVIIDLVRQSCEAEGVGLLMVTHSMEVANQFSRVDRLDEVNQSVASVSSAASGSNPA